MFEFASTLDAYFTRTPQRVRVFSCGARTIKWLYMIVRGVFSVSQPPKQNPPGYIIRRVNSCSAMSAAGTPNPFTYASETYLPKLRMPGFFDGAVRQITPTNSFRAFACRAESLRRIDPYTRLESAAHFQRDHVALVVVDVEGGG